MVSYVSDLVWLNTKTTVGRLLVYGARASVNALSTSRDPVAGIVL